MDKDIGYKVAGVLAIAGGVLWITSPFGFNPVQTYLPMWLGKIVYVAAGASGVWAGICLWNEK
jgi:hypothetical protein